MDCPALGMSSDDLGRRLAHNQREQLRARRINDQLAILKTVLESQGRALSSKADKLSILLAATRHCEMLFQELKSAIKPDAMAAVMSRIRKDDPTGDKDRDTQPASPVRAGSGVVTAPAKKSGGAGRRSSRGQSRGSGNSSDAADDISDSELSGFPAASSRSGTGGAVDDGGLHDGAEVGGASYGAASRPARKRSRPSEPTAMMPPPIMPETASRYGTYSGADGGEVHLGQLPVSYFAHLFDNTELAQCVTNQHGQIMAANRQFSALHPGAASDDAFPFAEPSERASLSGKVQQLFLHSTGTEPTSSIVAVTCVASAGIAVQKLVLTVVQGSAAFPPLLHITVLPTAAQPPLPPQLAPSTVVKVEPRMSVQQGVAAVPAVSVSPEMLHVQHGASSVAYAPMLTSPASRYPGMDAAAVTHGLSPQDTLNAGVNPYHFGAQSSASVPGMGMGHRAGSSGDLLFFM